MKRYLVGGLVTALAAGGLGFTAGGNAFANPSVRPVAQAQGNAVCTILPVLCPPTGTPPAIQTSLDAILAGGGAFSPAQVQQVVDQLGGTGLPTATLTATVTQVLEQLRSAAQTWPAGTLDGAMAAATLGQVLGQLPLDAQPTAVSSLVTGVVDALTGLLTDLADALVGTGVPILHVSDLATSLLAGDPAAIASVVNELSGIVDPAALQSLVPQIITALGDLGGAGSPFSPADLQALLASFAQGLTDAAGGSALSPAQIQGLLTGLVDALTGANASDPFGSLAEIATSLTASLRVLGSSTISNVTVLIDRLVPVAGPTTPTPTPNPPKPGAPGALATPTLVVAKYATVKQPRFSGRGTAGATVTVRTTAGRVLATVRVPSGGSWAVTSKPRLKRAAYKVVARQSATGRTGSGASTARTVRVVSAKPVQTQKRTTKSNRPVFKGVGYPAAKITLRTKAGRVLATTKVKGNGTYKVRSKRTLRNGTYKVRASQKRGSSTLRTTLRTIKVR